MYKITLVLLLVSTSCYSQFYTGVVIDPNKAFGIIDNPRTEQDHQGLHFDVEIGMVEKRLAYYALYGSFREANYQKLALGVDYFFIKDKRIEMAFGSNVSNIWKKENVSSPTRSHFGWLGRLTGIFWISDNWGLVGHFQYQSRPDLRIRGIFEGKAGIRYFFRN